MADAVPATRRAEMRPKRGFPKKRNLGKVQVEHMRISQIAHNVKQSGQDGSSTGQNQDLTEAGPTWLCPCLTNVRTCSGDGGSSGSGGSGPVSAHIVSGSQAVGSVHTHPVLKRVPSLPVAVPVPVRLLSKGTCVASNHN